MDGRNRLSTFKKRGAVSQEERRRNVAEKRRKVQDNKRFRAFEEHRGLHIPEPSTAESSKAAPSRVQKFLEWKKNKNATKNKSGNSSVKPAFKVCSKVRYDDTHLYKPPESSKFNAPKGVVAIMSTAVPQRQLRSQSKKNGPSKTIMAALNDFASAMKVKNVVKNVRKEENLDSDMLNRTYDSSDFATNSALVVNIPSEVYQPKQVSETTSHFEHGEMVESDPCTSTSIVKCFDTSVKDHGELLTTAENLNSKIIRTSTASTGRNTRSKSIRKSKKASLKVLPEMEKENDPNNEPDCNGDNLNLDKMEAPPTPEKEVEYFRSLYKQAKEKLGNLCSEWDILKSEDVPETIKDSIDVAIGYAKLLSSQRLEQYAELINEHEKKTDETELKVLSSDLDGFWNVVNNQLQDIYKKFEELSSLRENDWKSPIQRGQQKKNKPIAVKANKAKGKTTSGLRSFLAQARRKVMNENDVGSSVSLLDQIDNQQQRLQHKTMSPVVMKVGLRAKQIGSPKVESSLARSPLKNANHVQVTFTTPTLSEKTPRRRTKIFTPGLTPVRRSTRLASILLEDLN